MAAATAVARPAAAGRSGGVGEEELTNNNEEDEKKTFSSGGVAAVEVGCKNQPEGSSRLAPRARRERRSTRKFPPSCSSSPKAPPPRPPGRLGPHGRGHPSRSGPRCCGNATHARFSPQPSLLPIQLRILCPRSLPD